MKIVQMDVENVAYCVAVAKELHSLGTFGQNGPEFDWDWCRRQFLDVIRDPSFFHRFAIDRHGTYVGGIIGHTTPFMFSPRVMALEDAWYVRDGAEDRTKTAVTMMRMFINWAFDEHNVVLVQTGDIAAIDSVSVDNLYRHLGFKRFGTVYKYVREA